MFNFPKLPKFHPFLPIRDPTDPALGGAAAAALPAPADEARRLRGALPRPGGLRRLRRGGGAPGAAPERRAADVAGGAAVPGEPDRWGGSGKG